ncbi:hypothetical protein BHE74_00027234 [Ensete ventricosum]|nr:hypothetical protein GW17_00010446 [Ensete ventricosum]RWW65501.1 hypothetical protein BHE74_00027234 [Ensete ventricosum]
MRDSAPHLCTAPLGRGVADHYAWMSNGRPYKPTMPSVSPKVRLSVQSTTHLVGIKPPPEDKNVDLPFGEKNSATTLNPSQFRTLTRTLEGSRRALPPLRDLHARPSTRTSTQEEPELLTRGVGRDDTNLHPIPTPSSCSPRCPSNQPRARHPKMKDPSHPNLERDRPIPRYHGAPRSRGCRQASTFLLHTRRAILGTSLTLLPN